MKNRKITYIAAGLVFLLALGLTLYPIVSNYVNVRYASQIHTAYQEVIQQTDNTALEEARKQAAAYNAAITPGASQDNYSQEGQEAAAEDYESLLNLGGDGIMGYVEIPKIQVLLPIFHGTESGTLERGVGHLLGSSLPVGGESTHAILTGHSGMASQKMFTDLEQLETGDVFYLQVLGDTLAYQVDQIHTVLPHDTTRLGVESGQDLCTLVTCTPYGVNSHRLLVRGCRIPYEEAEELVGKLAQAEQPSSTWGQKYAMGIALGLLIVLVIVMSLAFTARLRRQILRKWRRKRNGGGKYAKK